MEVFLAEKIGDVKSDTGKRCLICGSILALIRTRTKKPLSVPLNASAAIVLGTSKSTSVSLKRHTDLRHHRTVNRLSLAVE